MTRMNYLPTKLLIIFLLQNSNLRRRKRGVELKGTNGGKLWRENHHRDRAVSVISMEQLRGCQVTPFRVV